MACFISLIQHVLLLEKSEGIADFISGTLAYVYDEHKRDQNSPNYLKIIESKLTYVRLYPKEYHNFQINVSVVASDYDEEIAELCFKQAAAFLDKNKSSEDLEIKAQCIRYTNRVEK